MEIAVINDMLLLEEFTTAMNESFKQRSSNRIPYEGISADELNNDKTQINLGAFDRTGKIIGGLSIKCFSAYGNTKTAKIFHLWTDPGHRRKGVASNLLKYAEKHIIQDGCQLIQLDVANIYKPAYRLYKKSGYKPLKIFANIPKTYYFVRMIKEVEPFHFGKIKRLLTLIKSSVIFFVLYKRDSSPKLLCRIIYGKK